LRRRQNPAEMFGRKKRRRRNIHCGLLWLLDRNLNAAILFSGAPIDIFDAFGS
jgi:hypothetical protein